MINHARDEAFSMPLEKLDPANPSYFQNNTMWHYFERLRKEDPVHYCKDNMFGAYWSVTKYRDIFEVDNNFKVFSSASGIALPELPLSMRHHTLQMFIAMDPPKHTGQRKAVSPIVSPNNLMNLEGLIRERVIKIIESLPVNETFNFVDKVSIELTTQMLATLFDFPFEERRKLTYWSDIASVAPSTEQGWKDRQVELEKCLAYFTKLWNERVNAEPKNDLISMLAHNPATRDMSPQELLGNVILLIVGGNDTTRNSISGGLYFLNQNPKEYDKLRANPSLIPNMVSEIIRYQTPLAHMRRQALVDYELNGKLIKAGDKVVMWYISGNRDEDEIKNADAFLIDRENARQHLSFGFGIHRCVGNRLAEMQLKILWEELLKRYPHVEVVSEPKRIASSFVHGYSEMMVRINH